jgi:hypothetical protein
MVCFLNIEWHLGRKALLWGFEGSGLVTYEGVMAVVLSRALGLGGEFEK